MNKTSLFPVVVLNTKEEEKYGITTDKENSNLKTVTQSFLEYRLAFTDLYNENPDTCKTV